MRRAGSVLAGLAAAAVALLVLLALRPASTAAIEGPDPIAAREKVELNGRTHTVLLRGADQKNPLLLFVHGGPGASHMPLAPLYSQDLEREFVVVHWDQVGAGASCAGTDWQGLSQERTIEDAIALSEQLVDRFGQDKIVLLGHSWGSIIGARAVQRRPDLFHAYIGLGQLVHGARNEELSLAWVRKRAEEEGNESAIAELADLTLPYPADNEDLRLQRDWLLEFGGSLHAKDRALPALWPFLLGPEYTLAEHLTLFSCLDQSLAALWPSVAPVDFLETIPSLDVPVFFFNGRHDWNTPTALVEEWSAELEAPSIETVWFEDVGHLIPLEAPEEFQRAILEHVLPHVAGQPEGDVAASATSLSRRSRLPS